VAHTDVNGDWQTAGTFTVLDQWRDGVGMTGDGDGNNPNYRIHGNNPYNRNNRNNVKKITLLTLITMRTLTTLTAL